MTATIKDIAKKTNLGYATISAYLNGVRVKPQNKALIENAINELGYVRNEYARGLKTHRSMTIGVLIPELSDLFSTKIISVMEDFLREKGYGIIVSDYRSDSEIEQKSLQFLMSKMVDGLIVMPISMDGKIFQNVIDRNVPIVIIDRLTDNKDVSYIIINNREVSKNAVKMLIEKGHKEIALITGNNDVYTARERRLGYQDALQEVNNFKEEYIYDGSLTIEGGYLAMKQVVENHKEVTAIFVTNYDMTIGSIIAINELGKHIPEDYSFVGFDNMELSKVFSPKLATVNQPMNDIGRMSAEMLLDLIDKKEVKTVILNAEIMGGASIRLNTAINKHNK